ncbi:MAG: BTAD domain-containing putative transcriptional regulator [Anaerolineales bacterium]
MLEIRLLGQFDVRLDGSPVEIPSRPAQTLLAYLAFNPGVAHRREKLAGMLWPEAGDTQARNNLRYTLWQIRKALARANASPETYLTADKITVTLRVWCDAAEMLRPVKDGSDPADLVQAASLYGGELLPGFYEDWVVLERERLRAAFESKVQKLLEVLAGAERWPDLLEWAERWIAVGQANEPAYRALMLAHAGMGDRAGVAAAFSRCVAALRSDLDVEPSDQTRQLHADLTQGRRPVAAAVTAAAGRSSHETDGVRSLLRRWREQDRRLLDLSSLALVHASADLALEEEEALLLFRSALHYEVDLSPWVARAGRHALPALHACYREHPKPAGRMRIVEALEAIEGDSASELLLEVVGREDSPSIRSRAALALARRGRTREAVSRLLAALQAGRDVAAIEALVSIADEVGLPADAGPYPKTSLALEVGLRRWSRWRGRVVANALRGALGTALGGVALGASLPLLTLAASRDVFEQAMAEYVTLPAWMISGAVAGLVWQGFQGLASCLAVGAADALSSGKAPGARRTLCGALAGLVHSGFLIVFSATGLLDPKAGPAVYVPVSLAYGLIVGALLTLLIPPLGQLRPMSRQLKRGAVCWLGISLAGLVVTLLLYPAAYVRRSLTDSLFGFVMSFGLSLAYGRAGAAVPAEELEARPASPG